MFSSKLLTVPTLLLISLALLLGSCRKECRELGKGAYWHNDGEPPAGPGPCLDAPDAPDRPRPHVNIQQPYLRRGNANSPNLPIEINFRDNVQLREATIRMSHGWPEEEYYSVTVKLDGISDNFMDEVDISGLEMLGRHNIRVTVKDNLGWQETSEHDFLVEDIHRPIPVENIAASGIVVGDDIPFRSEFTDASGIASIRVELTTQVQQVDPITGEVIEVPVVLEQRMDFPELPQTGVFEGAFSTEGLLPNSYEITFTALDALDIDRSWRLSGRLSEP